jgi:hypothetical protein
MTRPLTVPPAAQRALSVFANWSMSIAESVIPSTIVTSFPYLLLTIEIIAFCCSFAIS